MANHRDANPVPLCERKYLTKKEAGNYTGIGLRRMTEIISAGEFQDYIVIGKQRKVMVDRVAFEEFLKNKKYI